MMVTLNDVTELTLDGNGSFDKLMRAVRLHINDAIQKQEISQSEAGQIYVNVIPSIIQEAVRFEMQKDILNEQLSQEKLKTEIAQKDSELKDKQLDIAKKDDIIKEEELKEAKEKVKNLIFQNGVVFPNEERRKQELFATQLELSEEQVEEARKKVQQIEIQTRALAEQVVDNRWIKTIQNFGTFLSGGLNGGMQIPPSMFQSYFGYMAKLNGIRAVEYGTLADGDLSTDSDNPTEIKIARNNGIEYPYGGVNKNDPMKRNDFTSYTYKIELGYDSNGKPNTKNGVVFKAVWEDDGSDAGYEITIDVQHGDVIMQSGLPDKPRLVKVENHVKLAE